MPDVFIASDNILSPLGLTTAENFSRLVEGDSGVAAHEDATMSDLPFYASLFGKNADFSKNTGLSGNALLHGQKAALFGNGIGGYTKFEQLLIASIDDALQGCGID